MDITKMLENDHRKVEQLFKQVEGQDDDKRKLQIFDQIMTELVIHTEIEERLFYPACRKFEQLGELIDEALEEHAQAKGLLSEIDALREEALRLDAKITVLQEDIEHHVKEEEGELFPQVRKLMRAEQLEALGAQAEQLKQRLQEAGKEAFAQLKGGNATAEAENARSSSKRGGEGKSSAGSSASNDKKSTAATAKKSTSTTTKKSSSKSGSKTAKGAGHGSK